MIAAALPPADIMAIYALTVAVLMVTPGPDMTFFLSKTIGQGRTAGCVAAAGSLLGCFVHTLLVAVGVAALLAASVTAFLVLKIVGAAYLLWLAWRALRHGSGFAVPRDSAAPAEPLARIFVKGLTVDLINPKVIVFFVTFLPQFVAPAAPNAELQIVMLGVLFVLVASPIVLAIILAAAGLTRRVQHSPRLIRVIDWLFAGVMGAFATKLLLARAS